MEDSCVLGDPRVVEQWQYKEHHSARGLDDGARRSASASADLLEGIDKNS